MNVLNVRNLRKTIGARTLFDGVAFTVDEGEKVGVIGANGCGKSTLFRIVAGLEGCDDGVLALRRGARVGYLAQDPEFVAGRTVLEAAAEGRPEVVAALVAYREVTARLERGGVALGPLLRRQAEWAAELERLGGWDWEHRVEAMLTRLGVGGWTRPVERLSGGEVKRVALARTLLGEPDLLLLDEPTNHLDADTVLWLEEWLAAYAGAVLLITHDRYFLDRVVDRMLEVAAGELAAYVGGYTEYLEAKAERLEREAAEEQKRRRLIEKELDWARRSPPARTGKARARLRRIDSLEAERRRGGEAGGRREAVMGAADAPRLGRTVLELDGLSKCYGDRVLIRGFTAGLRAGQRVGIIGPNGAGKTTLLRVLLGEEPADRGSVEWGANTVIAYFDQARSELDGAATVYEAMGETDWVTVGDRRVHLRSYLEDFLFPTAVQQQKVRSLSGGERNRLLLAKLLLRESNLLILDEPTNDLDLVTLQVLESVLEQYAGCVLVVTHDRYFLDKVATDLWVFEGDGVVRAHAGGYDLYRRLRDEREAAELAARQERERRSAPTPAPAETPPGAGSRRRLTWKEQRELDGIEAAILAAEEERERLAGRLADPAFYSAGGGDVAATTAAYQTAIARVDELYARWAELESRLEDAAAG